MLTKIKKNIGVSEFRKDISKYLKQAKDEPVVVSLNRGKDSRVVIDTELYNYFIDMAEDSQDAQELIKLKKKDTGERVSWEDVKKKYICD